MTVDALIEHQDVYVVIGESMIGNRIDISLPRVTIIRDYPNSMYFPAFDATVQAGGYNSFHEIRKYGLSKFLLDKSVFSYAIPSPRIFNYTSFKKNKKSHILD